MRIRRNLSGWSVVKWLALAIVATALYPAINWYCLIVPIIYSVAEYITLWNVNKMLKHIKLRIEYNGKVYEV